MTCLAIMTRNMKNLYISDTAKTARREAQGKPGVYRQESLGFSR